jgi:hypothetical protein
MRKLHLEFTVDLPIPVSDDELADFKEKVRTLPLDRWTTISSGSAKLKVKKVRRGRETSVLVKVPKSAGLPHSAVLRRSAVLRFKIED